MSKDITDTDENVMLPSQLVDVVSGTLGTSDFINERPGKVFSDRFGMETGTDEGYSLTRGTLVEGHSTTSFFSKSLPVSWRVPTCRRVGPPSSDLGFDSRGSGPV